MYYLLQFFKRTITEPNYAFMALVILAICQQTIFLYPVVIVRHIGPLEALSYMIFPMAYLFLAFYAFREPVTQMVRTRDSFIILFFLIMILLTIAFYPENTEYLIKGLIYDIWLTVPFFYIGLCFKTDEDNMDMLARFCCLGIVLDSAYRMMTQSSSDSDYNMEASYELLLSSLIVINYAFRSGKLIPVCCSLLAVFYHFSMGTRGPLVILFVCILVHFIYFLKKHPKLRWVVIIALIVVAVMIASVVMTMLEQIQAIFDNWGLSTRVFDMILSDEEDSLANTTGRSSIYEDLLKRLEDRPFLGYGVYGEWKFGYASAHNMYIEALFHYGWVLGSLMIVSYVLTTIMAYLRSTDLLSRQFLIILSCYVFVRGVFGGTYLSFGVFFLLGFCIQQIRKSNICKKKQLLYE